MYDSVSKDLKLNQIDELNFDPKSALWINILSIFMFITGSIFIALLSGTMEFSVSGSTMLVFIVVFLILQFLVLVIHELIHGIPSILFGHKTKFGFMFLYKFFPVGYTHSRGMFTKKQYYMILLSPFLFISIVGTFFTLLTFSNLTIFYLFSFFTIINFAGSAGDLYIAYRLYEYPSTIILENKEIKDPLIIWNTEEFVPVGQKHSNMIVYFKDFLTFIVSIYFLFFLFATVVTSLLFFTTPFLLQFDIQKLTIFGWEIIATKSSLSVSIVNQLDLVLLSIMGSILLTKKFQTSNFKKKKQSEEHQDQKQATIPFIA